MTILGKNQTIVISLNWSFTFAVSEPSGSWLSVLEHGFLNSICHHSSCIQGGFVIYFKCLLCLKRGAKSFKSNNNIILQVFHSPRVRRRFCTERSLSLWNATTALPDALERQKNWQGTGETHQVFTHLEWVTEKKRLLVDIYYVVHLKIFWDFDRLPTLLIKISYSITINVRWQFWRAWIGACQICSIFSGVLGLGSTAMEFVLRELSGRLRSSEHYIEFVSSELWISFVILLFVFFFSMSLISFFETIEKLYIPWIWEWIVPHLRGVTVYFQPLHSWNLMKCCLSTDIYGISDHDLMYSHEDVETADEHSVPDREAVQARVSYPAV